MKILSNKKFKATDWARPSVTVEGNLTLRDRKTLEHADSKINRNGYVVCIENEDGYNIVNPESIEPIN